LILDFELLGKGFEMKRFALKFVSVGLLSALAVGCGGNEEKKNKEAATPDVDGSKYVLAERPEGAIGVREARENSKDGDEVVIVGRVGGTKDPWIEGRAAFQVADESLRPCNEIPGDNCPYPWDYCCDPDLNEGVTLVTIVDDEGKAVKAGAKELFELKELDTVVVKGTVKSDDAGGFEILATGFHKAQ
jgi:hypothetical protein